MQERRVCGITYGRDRNAMVARIRFSTGDATDWTRSHRGNNDDQTFTRPELLHTYLDLLTWAAAQSRAPHYVPHSRPGS